MFIQQYDSSKTLCIDAILACAFARSQKMMRLISTKYNSNKDFFYNKAQESPRFKSRFITGSRIDTRLSAIQALGLIIAAKEDSDLNAELLKAAEKAFKQIANKVKSFKDRIFYVADVFEAAGVFDTSDDDSLHDTMAVMLYFCDQYQIKPLDDDPMYQQVLSVIIDKDTAFQRPFPDVMQDAIKEYFDGDLSLVTNLMRATVQFCSNSRSVADLGKNLQVEQPEYGVFQTLWDFAQLDNVPMSSYEKELFSRQEITDIFNVLTLHVAQSHINAEDVNNLYIMALMIRSFSRLYNEAVSIIDEYAGIVRESETFKDLQREVNSLSFKTEEQAKIICNKQDALNNLQLELDKAKKQSADLEAQLTAAKERNAVLESLLNEEETAQADTNQLTPEQIQKAKNINAVLFGGPPNWQATIKENFPNVTCIPIDNLSFDLKIVDKAQMVIFKTDYLSHAQWYRIVSRAKAKKKPIVYCKNNIDRLIWDIAKTIN